MTTSIYSDNCAISLLMIRRITVSVAIVVALFTATVRLPAAPCIIDNIAKTACDQQNITTVSATIPIPLAIQTTANSSVYSSVEAAFTSVPRLALLCTFLI